MFHNGAGPSILKWLAVTNSGTSTLGDYPLHWHLNGNSTRGTIVEGVLVENGANHAFVPHGSNGITFRHTEARNIIEPAYWWDDPGTNQSCSFQKFCTLDNSNDITYDHALAVGVTGGFRNAGFKLGAGSGNVIKDSLTADIRGNVDCAGYVWPESANQNIGGNVWVFENNRSIPNSDPDCHGIFVWQNDSNLHIIDGFTGDGIDHGAYLNNYEYRNVDVPYTEIHALSWEMRDSHAGHLVALKHTLSGGPVVFRNVTVDSFTVRDANDGGRIAGRYEFYDTNLTCSQINWANPVSGSRVFIDGSECDR